MRHKPTSAEIKGNLTRKEFDELTPELTPEMRDSLWSMISEHPNTSLEMQDWSAECSMCGKPMPYRFCGMCVSCEMIYNS